MLAKQAKSFPEQCFPGFSTMPGRGSGGMRQRNEFEFEIPPGHMPLAADDVLQLVSGNKLANRQTAYRDDKTGPQDFHFDLEPFETTLNFGIGRHAISTFGVLSWEATTHSGHINA